MVKFVVNNSLIRNLLKFGLTVCKAFSGICKPSFERSITFDDSLKANFKFKFHVATNFIYVLDNLP